MNLDQLLDIAEQACMNNNATTDSECVNDDLYKEERAFEIIKDKYGVSESQILGIAIDKKMEELLDLVCRYRGYGERVQDIHYKLYYQDVFDVLVKYQER